MFLSFYNSRSGMCRVKDDCVLCNVTVGRREGIVLLMFIWVSEGLE